VLLMGRTTPDNEVAMCLPCAVLSSTLAWTCGMDRDFLHCYCSVRKEEIQITGYKQEVHRELTSKCPELSHLTEQ
jgi:hypothetical protein